MPLTTWEEKVRVYFIIIVVTAFIVGTEAQTPPLVRLGSIAAPASTLVANEQLLIAADGPTMRVITLDNTESPVTVARYEFTEAVLGLSLTNDLAVLVANSHDGLRRLDLSDPAAPSLTGHSPTRGQAVGVASVGSHAFVADNSLGFDIVATSDGLNRIGEYLADGFPRGIAAAGALVFVADQPNGLVIVDVATPSMPDVVATLSLGPDSITRVVLPSGASTEASPPSIACVVSGRAGLQVVDLSDPTSPVVAAPIDTRGNPQSVAMRGQHVYVVSENTLEVFDLTEPSQPALLASQAVGDEANQIAVNNEFVFVATSEGIDVFTRP